MSDETHYFPPRFGELFGLPASEVPGSHREFRAWWRERLASLDLHATPRVREIFGISWTRAHETVFRSIAAGHRRARHAFPRPMRRGRNDIFFEVVPRSERRRGGTATPELHPGAT